LLLLLIAAAVLGDAVNYAIGYGIGPRIFHWEKSRFFKKDHLLAAHAFYERHGGKTIVLARFMPFIRTFAPFVAGIGRMRYRHFAAFNVIGGIAWVSACLLLGFWFGNLPAVQRNFHLVVLGIVAVSLLPLAVAWLRSRLRPAPFPVPVPAGEPGEEASRVAG
jgi:membrane-associated protein